jgi:hypothetical protein
MDRRTMDALGQTLDLIRKPMALDVLGALADVRTAKRLTRRRLSPRWSKENLALSGSSRKP